jgi:anaerobic magnesium-protoporphyrin IX monomethyl ester cyclase
MKRWDSVGMPMRERKGVKIALVNPPTNPEAFVDYQNPLIGLAYMAAVLEKNGYEVTVVDCPPLNMTHEGLRQEIARLEPDIVGITSVTATFPSVLQAAHAIKESYPRALIVLGGPHATIRDKQILSGHEEVDIVVRCEGEQTILDLACCVSNFGLKDLHEVAGITFRKNGQIIRTPNRPFIQDLDELPYPAYKYFPLKKYRLFGKLILPIITSRGCPFQCTFCMAPRMAGKRFRARSPKNVVDELEWLRDTYGADAFTFQDETFTYDEKRVFEICEEIKKRKIGLPWNCQTRVDHVSKEVLAKMREAKCQLVSFGVESGSQKILDAMKKGTTVEQNERAVRWAKEVGLDVSISVVMGYPGETTDTLKLTMDFIRKVEPDDVYLYLATPYPSIELHDLVKDLGWRMSKEWSHYEMQTPAFENPLLSFDKIIKTRETFYNNLYSPSYILRQSIKGTFYSKIMAETALHQLLWRIKLPWISANFKKLMRL